MNARLVLADVPGGQMTFISGGTEYRASIDPMVLGAEKFADLLNTPKLVYRLLDEDSRMDAMLSDIFSDRVAVLLTDYAEAVGLGLEGIAGLIHELSALDRLEIDLLRMGLEVRDWLDPDGPLSSRRLWLVIKDLRHRPETQIGAAQLNIFPADKAAVVAAQALEAKAEDKEFTHYFLRSPDKVARDQEQMRIDAEKRERIKDQQLRGIVRVERDEASFKSAQSASQAALAEIIASQSGGE